MSSLTPDFRRRGKGRNLSNRTRSWGELQPDRLASVLRQAELGEVESWADLASYMIRSDPHLHSLYGTRVFSIASAEWRVEPAIAGDPLAEAGAELCRQMLMRVEELERKFSLLQHATMVGWAVLEHDWKRASNGMWLSNPWWIHPRDVKFTNDCRVMIKSQDDTYIITDDFPGKFVVHLPQQIAEVPNLAGDLMAVAWEWLFKRWFRKFQINGTEKFANPFIYGEVPVNAGVEVRNALLENIEKLSADQVAVFEAGTGIRIAEISKIAGEAFQVAIDNLNSEMTKGLLGSTLNVEIGATGGNRAAAESQGDTTILPRVLSDAKRLAGTIERDWLGPFLRFNVALTGGVVAPTPRFVFELVSEDPPNIDDLAVNSGVVTVDELRVSRGLEPWGPERGGDRIITAPQPEPAPMFTSGGDGSELPLSRTKVNQDLPFVRAKTMPISTHSKMTPIEAVLLGKSAVPAKRPSARRSSPSKG